FHPNVTSCRVALLLVIVGPLHDDAATGDVGMELLELVRLLADRGLEGGRSVDAMEMDLQLRTHTAPSRRGAQDAPGVLPVDWVACRVAQCSSVLVRSSSASSPVS